MDAETLYGFKVEPHLKLHSVSHNFLAERFNKPMWCDYCGDLIKGVVGKQGDSIFFFSSFLALHRPFFGRFLWFWTPLLSARALISSRLPVPQYSVWIRGSQKVYARRLKYLLWKTGRVTETRTLIREQRSRDGSSKSTVFLETNRSFKTPKQFSISFDFS